MNKPEHKPITAEELLLNIDIPESQNHEEQSKEWGSIGQPRAVAAIEMGVNIKSKGYNIFVSGDSGTGRTTAVLEVLNRYREKSEDFRDLAYVFNFDSPDNPQLLTFAHGGASKFKEELNQLVTSYRETINKQIGSDVFKKRRDKLLAETEKNENRMFSQFEKELLAENFMLVQTEEDDQLAADIVPIFDDEGTTFDVLQDMVTSGDFEEEEWNRLRKIYFKKLDKLKTLFSDIAVAREEMTKQIEQFREGLLRPIFERLLEPIKKEWNQDGIPLYLDRLKEDMLNLVELFLPENEQEIEEELELIFQRYEINIILDNSSTKEVPLIHELNPTKANLFGAIETKTTPAGETETSFMMIKAGSLIKADGGFLILRAVDIMNNEASWQDLKRALDTQRIELEVQSSPLNIPSRILKPEAVKINVKVIVVAPSGLYENLCALDNDFRKLFKISAEFDSIMELNNDTLVEYQYFITSYCEKNSLPDVSEDGMKEICKYGIWLSDRRDTLSTRFSIIADLIQESAYQMTLNGKEKICKESVEKAIKARDRMFNLPEESLLKQISRGIIDIPTSGKAIGQVSGLAVLERAGVFSFGIPLKVTASVGLGKEGIINIEREAGLSGEIHNKGMLILEGYLRRYYGKEIPLSFTASICVEQSYNEIDGDSASSTELYALISEIAQIELRQDIAVTGSVNQLGEIQVVGGVSEKIESFYKICKEKGLTGTQGVIIPAKNRDNLILNSEMIESIQKGLFNIYPVKTIDDGLEILTGLPAGNPEDGKKLNKESIFYKMVKSLTHFSKNS